MTSFRDEIVQWLDKTGMPPTAFGQGAVQDPAFVAAILKGRSPRLDTVDRVRDWMRHYEAGGKLAAQRLPAGPVATAPYSHSVLTFSLDQPSPLLSESERMHVHAYRRRRQALAAEIRAATEGLRPELPWAYARVTVRRKSMRDAAADLVYGGARAVADCLLVRSGRHPSGQGIVLDGAPERLALVAEAVRVQRRADQGTLVTIEEMPGPLV